MMGQEAESAARNSGRDGQRSRQSRTSVPFAELATADLVVDANYEGGRAGQAGDDPMGRLLPVGNQGVFRYSGSPRSGTRLVVLYTSGADPDWPDALDRETGRFTYFGDNKTPGRELHDTQRGGNELLRRTFEWVHGAPARRDLVGILSEHQLGTAVAVRDWLKREFPPRPGF